MAGRIFVLIGPSGVGKTTLADRAQRDGIARRVVTCTTREPRSHEVPNRDYYFLTLEDFAHKDDAGEFVENEWIHGNRYGVLVRELERVLNSNDCALISMGYGGAERVKTLWPQDVTIIGILPPSWESLRIRLQGRGTREDEMTYRLRAVERESQRVRSVAEFVVVNDELRDAYDQLRQIITTRR